ncbi:hypothetical protein AQJ46_30365 [Streptomyces canus]|uniref:Lipoprotein n=1 Tax=Streptomyces canus TaxID=58343 RepID=A0A124HX82_9ACTN|nr:MULTISPECIES: hypothetical protein [Streptomyces]KUN63911.1 hypothetical protein AQJ46_30365 [Streptomyces canus]MDI5910708.1 hypothetical protein [Streptomyces sp. 12257]
MPYPPPPHVPSGPRRRSLLASVAGGALLAGCSDGTGSTEEGTAGSPSVVERARARAARDSRGIVERYDAVLAAYPALAEQVGPLRAEAVRHAEAFGETVATSSPTASPASPSPSVTVPTTEKDALAQLAAAERALADRRAKALLDVPGELARLLASVAAAGAAHAYLLMEGSR